MKNTLKPVFKIFAITILLLGIASSGGCKPERNTEPEPKPEEPDSLYQTGILLPEEAKPLFDTYERRRVGIIQEFEDAFDEENPDYRKQNPSQNGETGGKGDPSDPNGERFDVARYVYYDYEDIKEYLAYIENEAKLSGETISTLRFYFGNYPEDSDKSVKHPRQNTILISPTINRNNRENIFFTVDGEEGKRKAILVGDYFTSRENANDGKTDQMQEGNKNEASIVPSLFSSNMEAPIFQESRGTTKNRGGSAPPPHADQ